MTTPKILIYDIETVLMSFYAFSPGKQYLSHNQLIPGKSRYGIICITYCFNNEPVKCLKWEPVGGLNKLIADFDAIIKQADHIIGKNNKRFDDKMINGMRIFTDQPGVPDWVRYTDDLERQMRRYFRLPSQSLDYISYQMGLGGKVRMQMSDWIEIDQYMTCLEMQVQGMQEEALEVYCSYMYRKSLTLVLKDGKKAFDKMCKYGMKDTRDTRQLWNKLCSHFEPKFNVAVFNDAKLACKECSSYNIMKNGTRVSGGVKYQSFLCNDCLRYAGRTSYKENGDYSKITLK